MTDRIKEIREIAMQGYRRPKTAKGNHLDYDKVDWAELQRQIDAQPHGDKKWVIFFWTRRLSCCKRTLYKGLKYHKENNKT